MSQYFFKSSIISSIVFSGLVFVSFCDYTNQLEFVLYGNSTLEKEIAFDRFLDANATVLAHKPLLAHGLSRTNYSKNLTYYDSESVNCDPDHDDCSYNSNYKCCRVATTSSLPWTNQCIEVQDCHGWFDSECNVTAKCQKELGLECVQLDTSTKMVCMCPEDYGYDYTKTKCVKSDSNDPGTAMQIYKITMIFASCCLALILIIFLVCILRKSYCAPRQQQMVPLDNTTIPDIFTLFPHVGNYDGGPLADGTQPPFEKPPTYDETLTLIRNEIGIPPPAYRSRNGSQSTNRSNQSTPPMSTRVLISSPVLVTVQASGRSNTSVQSSSDLLEAGPSGASSASTSHSDRGIDNPAFC